MMIASLTASRLSNRCPRFSKCQAWPCIAGGKLVTYTNTQLEAKSQSSSLSSCRGSSISTSSPLPFPAGPLPQPAKGQPVGFDGPVQEVAF
jgi:hypothetical protein